MSPSAPLCASLAAAVACAGLMVWSPDPCFAGESATACIQSHEAGLSFERDGRLLEARGQFHDCTANACPSVVRDECRSALAKLTQRIPKVILGARDADGDVVDLRIHLDGKSLAKYPAGRAIEIDPGRHNVRFVAPDGRTIERQVVVREGERRKIVAEFAGAHDRAPAEGSTGDAAAIGAVVLGSIAVVATGGFFFFAITGLDLEQEQRDSCAPRCDPDDADPIRLRYALADVMLGVAVVSLAGGTYLWLSRDSEPTPPREASVLFGLGGEF